MPQFKIYGGITREELEHFRVDLQKEGIEIPQGDSGTLSYDGVEILVVYDAGKETLKVSLSKKPFYFPEDLIWQVVDTAVEPYVGP